MLRLPKTWLNRFLYTHHAFVVRLFFACLGAVFAALTTFSWVLTKEVFNSLLWGTNFMLGMRRLSWYARRSWLNLNVSRDPVYVFCRDMNKADLQALKAFLLKREAALDPAIFHADLMYISAMHLMLCLEDKTSAAGDLDRFNRDVNRFLAAFGEMQPRKTNVSEAKKKGVFSVASAGVALTDLATVFGARGIPWFVLSGTFLGIVREGGFLAHDYDIDVGVHAEDVDLDVLLAAADDCQEFVASALEYQLVFEENELRRYPVFFRLSHANGVVIDIFIHHTRQNNCWHGSGLFRWWNTPFSLVPYELAGVPVLGPSDADRYLTENYGDWRVPVVEFNSHLDTTNQQVVRNPMSLAIFLRRAWIAGIMDPKLEQSLLEMLRREGLLVRSSDTYELAVNELAFSVSKGA